MQTGELSEGEEQTGIAFMADKQSSIVSEPGNGPFDFQSLPIPFEHTAILSVMACPSSFAMRADELDAIPGQQIAQRIRIGSAIVDQSRSVLVEDMIVEQRFDQPHFGGAGTVNVDSQRQALPIDQQHQLAALTTLGWADAFAPFFAGTNVASAIATCQSIRPFRSSLCSTRRQASSKTPLSIHSHSRRQ